MIELTALREQLKLLGHNLPEDQIISILKEMNIDYEDKGSQASGTPNVLSAGSPLSPNEPHRANPSSQSSGHPSHHVNPAYTRAGVNTAAESRVPYKESVDFEAKQTAQPADLSFRFGLGQPPSKLFEGGNTRMTEEDRAVQGMQALKLSGSHTQPHSTAWSGSSEQGRTAQGVPSTSAQVSI